MVAETLTQRALKVSEVKFEEMTEVTKSFTSRKFKRLKKIL
jgi:hypothetical protein